jgi:hypothetical protein
MLIDVLFDNLHSHYGYESNYPNISVIFKREINHIRIIRRELTFIYTYFCHFPKYYLFHIGKTVQKTINTC